MLVYFFPIGILSQYEYKYEDQTIPFLWAPFLLLHLRGEDTITTLSMENNNLWLRHFLNLVVQVTLTLYDIWKFSDIIAATIIVAALIKYGEQTSAL